jgi:hypothetical protein
METIRLLGIQERDVYALFEMSHRSIVLLAEAFRKTQINVDKTDPDDVLIEECFLSFYRQLESLEKQLGDKYGSPSNPE